MEEPIPPEGDDLVWYCPACGWFEPQNPITMEADCIRSGILPSDSWIQCDACGMTTRMGDGFTVGRLQRTVMELQEQVSELQARLEYLANRTTEHRAPYRATRTIAAEVTRA